MKKREFVVLLSVGMLLAAVPVEVFAGDVNGTTENAADISTEETAAVAEEESEIPEEEEQDQAEEDVLSEETVMESTEEMTGEDGSEKDYAATTKIQFSDVTDSTHPYYTAVYWAAYKGVATGFSDNRFKPYDNCTRGQVVTFLWRLAGKPEPSSSAKAKFSDMVASSHPYYKAILWAVEKGITTGFSDGTFKPFDNCSRGQIVTFIYRYAGKPSISGKTANFKDMVSSSHPFCNPIVWASTNGITTGFSNNTFGPAQNCTRGQVVTFLYRYSNKTGNNDGNTSADQVLQTYAETHSSYLANGTYSGYYKYNPYTYELRNHIPKNPVTWCLADLDEDGQNELIIIDEKINEQDFGDSMELTLRIFEAGKNGNIYEADTCTLDYNALDLERTSGKWFLCSLNGKKCIGYEEWFSNGFRSNGWGVSFELLCYRNGAISKMEADQLEDSWGSVDETSDDYTWDIDKIGVRISARALAYGKQTICEDYLHGSIFCSIKSEMVLSWDAWSDWYDAVKSGLVSDKIKVTDITFNASRTSS